MKDVRKGKARRDDLDNSVRGELGPFEFTEHDRPAVGHFARERGRTSQFWNSTVIFVMWDEWGGWYDHVPPPQLDYDGLGFRVPLLVISPYAKQHYVSHVQYEHGSVLRFIEDTFGLGRLSASDGRANSPAPDCLDFTRPPRPFKPFQANAARASIPSPLDAITPIDPEQVAHEPASGALARL